MKEIDMPNGTCRVAECDRPTKARGWCHTHYVFWYKNRTEPTGPIRPWGQRRTQTCAVDGCDSPYGSLGYCAPHYKRFVKHGDPGSAEIRPRCIGDAADYALAHSRLKMNRGSASAHCCVRCDRPAKQWAYDHADPDEKTDERGYAYSLNLDHYEPMCVPCHKRFDLDRLSAAPLHDAGIAGVLGTE